MTVSRLRACTVTRLSEFNAEIVEILVENGTPVEFGQVLMRVKQS